MQLQKIEVILKFSREFIHTCNISYSKQIFKNVIERRVDLFSTNLQNFKTLLRSSIFLSLRLHIIRVSNQHSSFLLTTLNIYIKYTINLHFYLFKS